MYSNVFILTIKLKNILFEGDSVHLPVSITCTIITRKWLWERNSLLFVAGRCE